MEINKQPLQRVLAGFIVKDASAPIPLESHLVLDGQAMVGRVTSCNYSPTLKQAIGMAYIPPEQAKPGSMIQIKSTGGVMVSAQVTALPFYDPDNQRQKL